MLPKVVNIIAVIVIIILALAVFANSMAKPVSRDEQMYCTASAMLTHGRMIYKDFSYAAQLPYHPLICAALLRILNTSHYLLVGRIVSVLCDVLILICIVAIYRHVFATFRVSGTLFALAAAVLYIFNPLVDYANGYAWNHDVVILCVVLSFWLFLSTDFNKVSKYWRIAAIGALLTLASCMRITTVLVALLFFAFLLFQPANSLKQRLRTILPFVIASGFILIWPVWVVMQAPQAFLLNLFRIPALYGAWLHKIGMTHDKISLALFCLKTPGYLILIVIAIFLFMSILALRHNITITKRTPLLLAVLLSLTFFVIAFIPPTMWRQYLAIPVPFIVISFAFLLLYLRQLSQRDKSAFIFKSACLIVSLGVFVSFFFNPIVLYRLPLTLVPENWKPVELHRIASEMAVEIEQPRLVLTLGPLFAIEGGCEIYPELSCGSIIYRIADLMSPEQREITRTIGPETMQQLLKENPPSAVIVGVEPQYFSFLEAPLLQVVDSTWKRRVYKNGLVLYVRP
jgi:4-amino-4-deoxy-L-arabinose transferase-like glycosyltransferase